MLCVKRIGRICDDLRRAINVAENLGPHGNRHLVSRQSKMVKDKRTRCGNELAERRSSVGLG